MTTMINTLKTSLSTITFENAKSAVVGGWNFVAAKVSSAAAATWSALASFATATWGQVTLGVASLAALPLAGKAAVIGLVATGILITWRFCKQTVTPPVETPANTGAASGSIQVTNVDGNPNTVQKSSQNITVDPSVTDIKVTPDHVEVKSNG